MTPSPSHLRSDGFDFKLLRKDGLVALFEKTKSHYHAGYEVMLLRGPGKAFMREGKLVTPKTERMPKSHEWGKRGWSFPATDYESADRRFNLLVAREKRRLASKA